jgi:hypothetical protein
MMARLREKPVGVSEVERASWRSARPERPAADDGVAAQSGRRNRIRNVNASDVLARSLVGWRLTLTCPAIACT